MQNIMTRLLPLQHISVALLTGLCLSFLSNKSAASEYNLHVGPHGWVPFVTVKREGMEISHDGIMFDFLDQFEAAYPEFKRKHVLSTRKRVNALMENGEIIDVMLTSPLFVSAEIFKHYKFTNTLVRTYDKVISRKNKNIQYITPHDLIDKKVGTIRGYSYGHFDFLLNLNLFEDVRVDSHTQAIGMLEKDRIDVYIGNSLVSPLYIKSLGLDINDFVISDASLYEFNLSFAVNKNQPELYEKLNDFIADFVADGSFDDLLKSYTEE